MFTGSCLILKGDSLHFGVSTMEEIRLKKALKASMRRVGYPLLDENTSTNREKENIQALFGAEFSDTSDGNELSNMKKIPCCHFYRNHNTILPQFLDH